MPCQPRRRDTPTLPRWREQSEARCEQPLAHKVASFGEYRRAAGALKLVVVVLPDFGERYLSTALFTDLAK